MILRPGHRLRPGYFLSYVDGLGTSYARSFLASTHVRFYNELDRKMTNKRRFEENLYLPEMRVNMMQSV